MAGFETGNQGTGSGPPPERHDFDGQIFAGLFVASPEEVAAWDTGAGLTPAGWPAMEFKRLDTVRLGTLEAILTQRRYEDLDRSELHKLVRNGGPDGPWIMGVRAELLDALADLPRDRAPAVASQWADTAEFKLRPTDPPRPRDIEDLTRLLDDMTALARRSRESAKPMFLMMSL
jgi:hypothetical protein